MKIHRLLPLALCLATRLGAQEPAHVKNLAPDSLGVYLGEARAALGAFSGGEADRAALKENKAAIERKVILNSASDTGISIVPGSSSRNVLLTGTEHVLDGGFEGGIGYPTYGSQGTSGSGSWGWWHSDGNHYLADALSPIWKNYGGTNARTGQYMLYPDPFGPSATTIHQPVSIPPGNTATFSFWLKVVGTSSSASDILLAGFVAGTIDKPVATNFLSVFRASDSTGGWKQYSYDVSSLAGQNLNIFFQTQIESNCVFLIDDVSLIFSSSAPSPPATTCAENVFTMCLVNGRYRVTSHWKNQYDSNSTVQSMSKAKVTDAYGFFWTADASTPEYFIRFNTASTNGKNWVNISTFTNVEFWIDVQDTLTNTPAGPVSMTYHNPPGQTVNIWDSATFPK